MQLPPGQYLTEDFPVLSAGPTPRIPLDRWEFVITTEAGQAHRWSWPELLALPSETPTVDIHCVTKWSKLGTTWQGVSMDTMLAGVETAAEFALVHSYGGYTDQLAVGGPPRRPGMDRLPVQRRRVVPGAWRAGQSAGAAPVSLEVGEVGTRPTRDRCLFPFLVIDELPVDDVGQPAA